MWIWQGSRLLEYWCHSLYFVRIILCITIYRLCGFPPFFEENNTDLFNKIKAGEFDFPSPYWDDVSEVAKELIRKILVVDPKQRMTAEEILLHPWVVGDKTPRTDLANVTEQIKKFNASRKFKVEYSLLQ